MVRMLNMISDNVQALLAISPAKVSYMSETFKERMKRISARAGFKSQKAAADAIGCDRGNVGMWEAPSSPVQSVGQDWLFPVARTYKVRPEWLNDLSIAPQPMPSNRAAPTGYRGAGGLSSDFKSYLHPPAPAGFFVFGP